MKSEGIIALITLALIMGSIWFGVVTRFKKPVIIETPETLQAHRRHTIIAAVLFVLMVVYIYWRT